jgi:hypothetical protein
MRRPKVWYLKPTAPPLPGRVTLASRFSKSHAYVVVFDPATLVSVLPLLSWYR